MDFLMDSTKYRYKMSDPIRGKLIIINNIVFQDNTLKPRYGSEKDAARLITTFKKLGFECESKDIENKTAAEMLQIMIKVRENGLKDYDCLAVAILTHGEDNDMLYGTGEPKIERKGKDEIRNPDLISLKQLLDPLKRMGDGKPKLLFIQACRGYELDEGNFNVIQSDQVEADDSGERKEKEGLKIPMQADFLYHYSSSPGYVSFRNDKGSIFIQTLCDVLNTCVELKVEFDLVQCLTHVNRVIAGYESKSNNPGLAGMKQMPSIVSMLRQAIFLKGTP